MKITLRFIGIAASCPPLFPCDVKTFYLDVVDAARSWLAEICIGSFRVSIERPVVRWARHPRHGFVRFRTDVKLKVVDRRRLLRDLNGSRQEDSGMDAAPLPACFVQACLRQRDNKSLIVSCGKVIGVLRLDVRAIRRAARSRERRAPAVRRRSL